MPVSIINKHGDKFCLMLEAFCPKGYRNTSPHLYAERDRCPNTVMTILMMAPSGVIADAIEEEIDKMTGHRIMEIVHYLRTGEHTWQTERDTTSSRLLRLAVRQGYTPYPCTAVERMMNELRERILETHGGG